METTPQKERYAILPQIKIIRLGEHMFMNEKYVNDCVVQCYIETGEYPIIQTTSEYIAVIVNRKINVTPEENK